MHDNLFERLIAAGVARGIEVMADHRQITLRRDTDSCLQQRTAFGDVTDEVLQDLIVFFETVEEIDVMNIYSTDLFQYMAGDMIGQSTITLTIANVTMENMNSGKGAQTKPCLRFQERDKLMVLNKTNAKTLAAILGPETDNWKGARVTIAAPVVDAFGKSARSLRVVDVQPPAQIPAKPRNGNATQQPPVPTYGDRSPVAPSALDSYRAYLAANDNRLPADVRELIAWQQGDGQDDALFGTQSPLVTVDATQPGREYQD